MNGFVECLRELPVFANYLDNFCKVDVRLRSIFPSMLTLKKSLSTLLVLAIAVSPVLAEGNEAKAATPPEANSNNVAAASAPASPSLTSSAADANVMALLGLLVMKGVLARNEANAIRNAAPTATVSSTGGSAEAQRGGERGGFIRDSQPRSAAFRPADSGRSDSRD